MEIIPAPMHVAFEKWQILNFLATSIYFHLCADNDVVMTFTRIKILSYNQEIGFAEVGVLSTSKYYLKWLCLDKLKYDIREGNVLLASVIYYASVTYKICDSPSTNDIYALFWYMYATIKWIISNQHTFLNNSLAASCAGFLWCPSLKDTDSQGNYFNIVRACV